MPNLYDISPSPQIDRLPWEGEVRQLVDQLECSYVAPGGESVVVRLENGSPKAAAMRWGFRRRFPEGYKDVNNSRDDKLTSPMWIESWKQRRCVIPVLRIYEWSGASRGSKLKHAMFPEGEKQCWHWVAGLWERREERLSFSMITVDANQQVARVHPRMPVILDIGDCERFLTSQELPRDLIKPFAGKLKFVPELPSSETLAQGELF